MDANFDALNCLIDMLNEHVDTKLDNVTLQVGCEDSLSKNAETFNNRMKEVIAEVEKHDKKLAAELDPKIYQQLMDPALEPGKRFTLSKVIASTSTALVSTAASIYVIAQINAGVLLVGMVAKIGAAWTCVVAGVGIAVVAILVDMVASAIIGAAEEKKLREVNSKLDDALMKFEHPSKTYTKTILKITL